MFDPSSGNNKEQLVFWIKTYQSCGRWQEYKCPCRHAVAYFRNGMICHSWIFSNNMSMNISGTKSCNRYMNIAFSQLYKIRSDMMDKPIHQHWGQDNLDNQKQNDSRNVVISLTQRNLQLSVLSVEKQDIIVGHAPMLHHDVSLSHKYMFSLTFH